MQNITIINKKSEINNYDFIENMSQALDGIPVSDNMFLSALEEILPICKFDFHQSTHKLDKDIKNLLSSKNHQSSNTVYQVYFDLYALSKSEYII